MKKTCGVTPAQGAEKGQIEGGVGLNGVVDIMEVPRVVSVQALPVEHADNSKVATPWTKGTVLELRE